MIEVSWPQQGQKTGSSILQKVPVANGSGWYLKKGRSALIEISFQPYKSHFVVALLYIHFSKNESDFLYFLFIKTKLEQGIRELDIKYGKVCHKLSYNIVNSRQDAEECVNDAYLGAWNAIPPAKPNPLLTYICKIVRNIYWKSITERKQPNETALTRLLWRRWKPV